MKERIVSSSNEQKPKKHTIEFSRNFIDLQESLREIKNIPTQDFSKNEIYTKEMALELAKETLQKERFWNLFVKIINNSNFTFNKKERLQILDVACSVCEEAPVLHAFFGGEDNPYYNLNDNVVITGVDIDEEAIKLAEKNIPRNKESNFRFVVGDASDLAGINNTPQLADIVLLRHQQMSQPNYNKDNKIEKELWRKIIVESIKKVENKGLFIITSYTEDEHNILFDFINRIDEVEVCQNFVNEYSEKLGNGGIDKFILVLKKNKDYIV